VRETGYHVPPLVMRLNPATGNGIVIMTSGGNAAVSQRGDE
jgi:hypothetical protein